MAHPLHHVHGSIYGSGGFLEHISIFTFFYVGELGTNTSFSVEFLAGMVYTSQSLTMIMSAPIWGTLADRMGRKLMVERAMFGGAIILSLQFLRCGYYLPLKNNRLVQMFCPSPKGLKM